MKKNLISALAGAGLVLATAMPAMAADMCKNGTTGPRSWNVCVKASVKLLRTPVNNTGSIGQSVVTTANTGNNQSNGNTAASTTGIADPTGNASSTVMKEAILNTTSVKASQTGSKTCPDCGGLVGKNYVTGPDSVNIVGVVDVKAADVSVNNNGTISQNVNTNVNTGNNTANGNTISGTIYTGNATAKTELYSQLNTTDIVVRQ